MTFPPPVPPLPDASRVTSYDMVSPSTGPFPVDFDLYGDGTDYQNWIEVWLNGVRQASGWAITSPSGPLATLPRPITDAVVTFAAPLTGTVQIVGARRPRRVSQFPENRGVAARDLNQALSDIVAVEREAWDFRGRTVQFPIDAGITNVVLPEPDPGMVLRWRVDGNGFENGPPVTAPPFVEQLTPIDRTAIKALDTSARKVAFLNEPGREGMFLWKAGNFSSNVASDPLEGLYIKADATPASVGAWVRVLPDTRRVNVTWFGAVGDGTTNNAAALQAAVDLGDVVDIPAGVFNTDAPILKKSSASDQFKAGMILRGAGAYKTTLKYTGAADVGVLTFETADFSGVKFIFGVEVSDLTITQTGGAANVDGIRLTATWMSTIRRLRIVGMSRHGIHVPYQPGFDDSGGGGSSTGSDVYQDLYPIIEHCQLFSCSGWGIRFAGGNAAGPFEVAHNQFVGCVGGGFYTEVGQGTVRNNVFTSCGTPVGDPNLTGGMIVDSAPVEDSGPTPYGLRIIHNEFDTNYIQHLRLKSAVSALLERNRFISNVVGGVMTPDTHVAMGRLPESKVATLTKCSYNAHRSTSPSALAVTWYFAENAANAYIENSLDILSPAGRVKYFNVPGSSGNVVIESNQTIVTP